MKLRYIADIKTGLVLSRKKAKNRETAKETHNILTLKSCSPDGIILKDRLEQFESDMELNEAYLTRKDDVVIRLSEPYTAVHIDSDNVGLLISSHFCVIRLHENVILPEFLAWLLNSKYAKKEFAAEKIGSTVSIIRASFLHEFEIKSISKENQKLIVEINKLRIREHNLLSQLIEEKEKLCNQTIYKIVNKEWRI